jgi:hypothetical protein
MSAVLRAKGQDISPGQLASLFHDPLAGYSPRHSIAEIGKALGWCLINYKPSSSLSSLLDTRYRLPHAFEQSGGSAQERSGRIKEMQRELDASTRSWAGDSLKLTLDNARETAAALRQQAGIMAALMGEDAQGVRETRQMADRLRARATEIEGRAGQRMATEQADLDNLPIKQAGELQPLHTITASIKQFNGNMLEDGRFVSDGMMMLDAEALSAAQAKRVRGKVHPKVVEGKSAVSQTRAQQEVWDKALSVAQTEAVLLGHRLGTAYVVPRDGDGSVTATLDASVLRFIEATTGFDRVLVEDKPGEKRVVFYKGDRPVACTASTGEGGVQLDIPTARRVAAAFPKPEAKSNGKRQAK